MNEPGGSPVCADRETLLPDGTAPGTVLQINDEPCFYYSADSLKHSTAASSVVWAICFAFPILKRQGVFFSLSLFFFLQWIKGGRDRSNKR